MDEMATCCTCRRSLPRDARHFYRHRNRPNGFHGSCIDCMRARKRSSASSFVAEHFAELAKPHDRVVEWDGGPTRITVLCVSRWSSEPRASVREGRGPVYTIPAAWLLEHSHAVAGTEVAR